MTKIYVQTVSGTFETAEIAEDARDYLLANDFEENEVILKGDGVISIFAASAREAQEAVDVLRNYGAVNITAPNII